MAESFNFALILLLAEKRRFRVVHNENVAFEVDDAAVWPQKVESKQQFDATLVENVKRHRRVRGSDLHFACKHKTQTCARKSAILQQQTCVDATAHFARAADAARICVKTLVDEVIEVKFFRNFS